MSARNRERLMLVLLLVIIVAVIIMIRPFRSAIVTESRFVTIPFETKRVASAQLPIGSEAVTQPGKAGRKVVYAYFEEDSFLGRVTSRTQIEPGSRPAERVETTPTAQVVEFGTAANLAFDLSATAESGVDIGVIGAKGTLLIAASGSVKYWKGGACGPAGDPGHDYTFVPIQPSKNVGALLFRVGDSGAFVAYSDLASSNGMRVLKGAPGAHVRAVINDAAGLYADNSGSFRIKVIAR